MEKLRAYTGADRLRDLIDDNSDLMMVAARFGISLGFGDKTVREVCAEDGVDESSFLAVCNLMDNRPYSIEVSLTSLMRYLRTAHSYFLEFLLPSIRRKLLLAVSGLPIDDVLMQLLKFFDDYCNEVRRHMEHENNSIFSYVDRLLEGGDGGEFRIADYSVGHTSMTEKLDELKEVFIRHYHVMNNLLLVSALNDIIDCNADLCSHCEIEDRLFMPAVERLEKDMKLKERDAMPEEEKDDESDSLLESMTEREKDILRCVACGMQNKEIAEKLFISINTVTTYRRNISAKLNIHSAAGLTVFAILHRLVDINDIDPHL
ncbi:MAG: LuxR C-terminal-related transcriptional regulator [Muribaculaceae bacterium]|nr:LuxR C-terminal-related transcriptional regulator [Muribaculaceae bacterium]MDE6522567.1 LuxR C-terminal-related transcriptional regulator [Muribaculaceae bacterium]